MVHALQRARDRLRAGGHIISIRPHRTWRPLIAIVANGRRLPICELRLTPFQSNLDSAEAALDRVVADGLCTLVGVTETRWRTYLDRLSQMRTYLELISPPRPRFPRGTRARLEAMWEEVRGKGRIEVTEPLVMNVLRRRLGRR